MSKVKFAKNEGGFTLRNLCIALRYALNKVGSNDVFMILIVLGVI